MNIPDSRSLATTRPGLQPEPKRLDLFQSLRKHIRLSIFLLVVLAGAGGYLAKQRDVRTYSSFAEIHVARNFQRMLQTDREMEMRTTHEYDIFRNEQIGLMLRPSVLEEGLRRADQLESGVWADPAFGPDAAVGAFAAALDIYLLRDTYRIAVDITGVNPDILQPALDGLLAAFLEAHDLQFSLEEDERPEILRQTLGELEETILKKRNSLKALAKDLNVLDFKETRSNPWVTPLENARIALVEAERKAKGLRMELDAEAAAPPDVEAELDMVLLGGAESISEGLAQIVGPLVERRSAALNRLLDMNPGHAARAGLEEKVKSLEGQISDLLVRHAFATRTAREAELRDAELRITQLTEEVTELGETATGFVSSFQDGMILEASLVDDLERRRQLTERLNYFELEDKSPSFVSVALPASAVDPLGESKLMRNYAVAGLLALMMAFGLPILMDVRDNRIHTTKDVEAVLGFPPAIWIPERKKESQKRLAADQIRRFALALDRDQAYARSRLILFTEVKPSSGTQEMMDDMAKALASFGRKVLVVDAAAPLRQRAGSTYATPGFLGLMAGKGLQVLSRDGWDFLEYGNPMLEHGHSLSGWNGILRAAAQDYDMVLIKAGPLLASPDAEHMASSADLVVLVVEAETQTRGEVHRAGDVLAAIQPDSVGSILINAKVFRGHGYYSELLREKKALPPGAGA
ncbi:MAG: GumC domain-containing protein [Planctomycetota bacterium]